MSGFRNPLDGLDVYRALEEKLKKRGGPVLVTGLADAAKGQFAEVVLAAERPLKLYVTYDELRARELYEDLLSFGADAMFYPAKDLLFFAADVRSNELSAVRIDVRRRIAECGSGFVVTTIDALMDKLETPERFLRRCLRIHASDRLDLGETAKQLAALGYERSAEVDGRGQFSVRGGILDVFPVTEETPVRIELWDDEIDSMRRFDPRAWRAYTFTLRGKNCSAAATPFCAIFPGTSHSSYSMSRRVFSSVRARWSGNISRAPKAGPRAKRQRRPLSRPPSFGKTFRAVRPSAWRASTAAFRSSRYARNFQLRRRLLRASRVTLNS